MPTTRAIGGILRVDSLRLRRDRFLMGLALYIVGVSIAMRWAIPWITDGARARWGFDVEPYHALIMSHILVQLGPQLVGILAAFLLLESREDRTIKAMLVAPVPLTTYLWVAGAIMMIASVVVVVVEGIIVGIAVPPPPALLGAAIAGAPAAMGFAFAVASLSQDKTQAFAYLKIFGAAPLIPTGAFFFAEPLQWVAAVYPPYWAVKAYWIAEAGSGAWLPWVIGGLLVSVLWVLPLARMYVRAAHR